MLSDEEVEKILPVPEEVLRNYVINPEILPIHRYERNQEIWERSTNINELFDYENSPLSTTISVQRDPNTGAITGYKEVPLLAAGATARNSMALNRAPLQLSESVRGNALNIPFWPGSFLEVINDSSTLEDFDKNNLLTVPPGFSRGINFETDGVTVSVKSNNFCKNVIVPEEKVNLRDLIEQEEQTLGIWAPEEKPPQIDSPNESYEEHPDEQDILPKELPVIKTMAKPTENPLNTKYAIVLDCSKPIMDFEKQIPDMAYHYPFELDTFQKQAILQLEKHNHVFVAAHTSAGKTVVAEYAIALSQKHMTRSIYTSPIKALSNQKYRDFRHTFKDVGLITGDFQINQTASCLIMTTEILRSMLYCGSDVTRDLEYVIFDEVHYINDKERGHVWEQVLILLPAHVCVVMLSATVPNTIEFADWLGRTHKRKVYVVSTSHRPVPLEYYLYTGTGGKSKDDKFRILDGKGWHSDGYEKSKSKVTGSNRMHTKSEKTMWYALKDHLLKEDLLPVVVFTFSRVKCDMNAQNLINMDLTTAKEKSAIIRFFEESIRNLKEPDRNIPQIKMMREILQMGIGVHHSGILPIIKEIVEMLFQNRLLKLLFATETFAMGVNMPSRTVIFDSITKHDGRERRQLHPAEFIQMAGRAGRRGKDKKGTVIILCKGELPREQQLKDMMLGRPSHLISQFRLTYGMVLSLLRVETLSVEGMMSRSFHEADHQKNMEKIKLNLEKVEKELQENYSYQIESHLEPIVSFYEKAKIFLDERKQLLDEIIYSAKTLKELQPGKVIIVTHAHHVNKLALILSQQKKANVSFRVLILKDSNDVVQSTDSKPEIWYRMLSLARQTLYCPSADNVNHEVISVDPQDIFHITRKRIKIDTDLIVKDWEKRQIPRFRADPPGSTCKNAIEELLRMSMTVKNVENPAEVLQYMDFIKDIDITDHRLFQNIMLLNGLKRQYEMQVGAISVPNFEELFTGVFEKRIKEDERENLKYLLSNASMTLYPDYKNRIQLLRDLDYVDMQNGVKLKGRVACEMGMNELLITELVLRNVLKELQPAEVAALLSPMVFQGKTNVEFSELTLTDQLKFGIQELNAINQDIQSRELTYNICSEDFHDLNFGLVEVVYEWASAKPFSEIMLLTDVQEGIIVRCIQQLNEIICDVKNAARLIGDPTLQNKMEEASIAIKRDIVFAASLYTQRESTVLKP